MNTNLSTRKQLRPKSRKPKSDGPPKPDEEKAGKEQNDKEEKNGDRGQTGKEDKTGDKESNGEKSNLLPTTSLSTRVFCFYLFLLNWCGNVLVVKLYTALAMV